MYTSTIVEAATIGNHVKIGKNCIVENVTIIKDCANMAGNTIVPPNTVAPALALFAGPPGRFAEDLPESMQAIVEARPKQYYTRFQMNGDSSVWWDFNLPQKLLRYTPPLRY
ncbi:hypothetical protein B0H21DRAFT_470717 [Amylocystis lapponica]|nr:hypothetical protein B0H21DRAFT_470717 [Amylocystis lapponica]